DSTSIVVGSMIGSGIFIVSADMARQLGSPGWLLIAWILTGFMTLFAALSYGELAAMFPKAGGQYVYLREAYNPLVGFLYGWTMFLVIQTGTIAAVAVAFGKFAGVLFPWFSEKNILIDFVFLKINSLQLIAIISLIVLTLINLTGIRIGKIVQNFFTFSKTLALFGLIILGFFFFNHSFAIEANSKIFWEALSLSNGSAVPLGGGALLAAVCMAMVGSLFSSDAWNNITFTAGEVINPKRNIPVSLFLGTLIVTLIYILVNIIYLNILPLRGIESGSNDIERGIMYATNDRVGTAAMSLVIGNYAAIIMAVFIMVSTFGCNNGLILAGARIYYAMAKDNLFFKKAGELNSGKVPGTALTAQCIWTAVLCLTGTYSDLLDYVVFSVLIFYVLTIAGIFVLRKTKPNTERPYKAFGYPYVPVIYIIFAFIIMTVLLLYKPKFTWPGLFIVLLGIPVYYIRNRINIKKSNVSN
ncbi:MAG: basic amino acid/polyamine antiporter, family, partial [Bacteroidota bacterium]|nr:basic amino acid/polyamine antiporter, family [Bacteroidota bacterium]